MSFSIPRSQRRRSAVGGHALSDASVDGGARREGERERAEPSVGEGGGGGKEREAVSGARCGVGGGECGRVCGGGGKKKEKQKSGVASGFLPSFLPHFPTDHTTPRLLRQSLPPPSVGGPRRDTEACLTSRVI